MCVVKQIKARLIIFLVFLVHILTLLKNIYLINKDPLIYNCHLRLLSRLNVGRLYMENNYRTLEMHSLPTVLTGRGVICFGPWERSTSGCCLMPALSVAGEVPS